MQRWLHIHIGIFIVSTFQEYSYWICDIENVVSKYCDILQQWHAQIGSQLFGIKLSLKLLYIADLPHCIPFPISIEPEITELEVDQSMPEIILNLNSSMASRGSTFDIDLPQISMANGPFRLVCITYIVNKCDVC